VAWEEQPPNLQAKKTNLPKYFEMAATFFPQGIAHLNAAVAQDKAQNYKEALKLYVRSLEFFIAGLKCIFPIIPHAPSSI
jgi:hypothetical protein